MSVCAKCGHVHSSADVVALDRFRHVAGYRTPDGHVHATRNAGQEWPCAWRAGTSKRWCACGLTDPETLCIDCLFRGDA